jgi:hypothetical protein
MSGETEQICFSDKPFANLIFFPVRLNGAEVTAWFDTGAAMSFVTEHTARRAGITAAEQNLRAGNNTGATFEFRTGRLERLTAANCALVELNVGILPDKMLEFGCDDEENPFPGEMILGWDVISRLCWRFDMAKRTVSVGQGGSMPPSDRLRWNRFPIVNVTSESETLPVGFDCGHTETMLDRTWLSRAENVTARTERIQGVGSERLTEVDTVRELRIHIGGAAVTLSDIDIVEQICGAEGTEMTGLLGADILAGRRWTMDFRCGYFSLEE